MKKNKLLILTLIMIVILTGCSTSKKGRFESITYKEYKELIEKKESFVLEMMRTDCSHCNSLKPKLQEVINEYGITVKVINLEKLSENDEKEFAQSVGTTATPNIIFYNNGEEKSVYTRITGDVPKSKIIEKFKSNGIIE